MLGVRQPLLPKKPAELPCCRSHRRTTPRPKRLTRVSTRMIGLTLIEASYSRAQFGLTIEGSTLVLLPL